MNFSLTEMFDNLPLINVVDIGAMMIETEAPYSKLIKQHKARVIGFEPNPEECEKLNREIGPPHRFYPNFVGDGQPATYYETNYTMTGSLFEPNTPLLEKFNNLAELTTLVATHPIETSRLDDIEGIEDIDFIKIDVQGSEINVFKGASKALKSAVVIQTEVCFVELYKGQPLFSDIDQYLRSQGYQLHTYLGFGQRTFKPIITNDNPNAGIRQHLWSDAVYVKDWMHPEALTTTQLKKYAVLVHDLFASPDLCYYLLMQVDAREGTRYAQDYLTRCQAK
jgi:FkbM family methyltransferase